MSLFNDIIKRGYNIIYLTSRSLGQVGSTRGFLSLVNQQEGHLPEGPILLSPDSMFKSIIREIANYSEIFKEKALNELLQTFPPQIFPFHSGFGNRDGDARAYSKIGIPLQRIFIVKSKKKDEEYTCITNFEEVSLNLEENFPSLII